MHEAINTATGEGHYIYLLGWWLSDDFPIDVAPSTTVRALFKRASDAGVQVRAMLWDQAFSRQNTAEVAHINALAHGGAILDGQTNGTVMRVNVGSHHQKVLVVKGSKGLIAFCGGIDLNPDRIRASSSRGGGGASGGGSISLSGAVASSSGSSGQAGEPLHDVHCRIVGPSAHDLLTTFIRRWDAHPGHVAIDRSKGSLLGRSEPIPRVIPSTGRGSGTSGNCAVRITRTFNPVPPIAPGSVKERSIRSTLIAAIKNARQFIYMEDQYLINMEAATLLNAALAHLQYVTIVIPHSDITDMPRVWEGRLNFIQRLQSGPNGHKARVFFLSTPPNVKGTKPKFGDHTYVHAKTWVFDDELAVIGSANCNQRGWTNDSEVNAVIFEDRNPAGQTFAQRLRMRLWSEHLNEPASSLADPIASLSKWTSLASKARLRPYDPKAGSDSRFARMVPWSVIDPRA
jgi:phosphatidylserine/phosphatidylglycerophosphate/cardiolipin synthase-like enzyme